MKHLRLLLSLCLMLLGCAAARAQENNTAAPDAELERIKTLSKQARDEAEQFRKAGNKDTDEKYPGRQWAVTFWQYRLEHPGTPAAARATQEALRFLVRAELFAEFEAKADTLKADDPAWKELIYTLNEAAERKKDSTYFLSKVRWLDQHAMDKEVKARARFMQAQRLWQNGEAAQAKTLFQSIIAEFPDTPFARRAAGNIGEIEILNVGQPAPLFAHKTVAGTPLTLADYRGQVVLLEFWASW